MSAAQYIEYPADDGLIIGDDITLLHNVLDSAGAPQNLTGYTVNLRIRDSEQASASRVSKATGGSGITLGNYLGTNDRTSTTLAAADTANFTPRTYWFELDVTTPGGLTRTVAHGPMVWRRR